MKKQFTEVINQWETYGHFSIRYNIIKPCWSQRSCPLLAIRNNADLRHFSTAFTPQIWKLSPLIINCQCTHCIGSVQKPSKQRVVLLSYKKVLIKTSVASKKVSAKCDCHTRHAVLLSVRAVFFSRCVRPDCSCHSCCKISIIRVTTQNIYVHSLPVIVQQLGEYA